MTSNLLIEGGAVAGCALAILALGNSPKRRDHRIALMWLGVTIVGAGIADSRALQHDDSGALFGIVLAVPTLLLGAFFAVRAARISIAEISKRL